MMQGNAVWISAIGFWICRGIAGEHENLQESGPLSLSAQRR